MRAQPTRALRGEVMAMCPSGGGGQARVVEGGPTLERGSGEMVGDQAAAALRLSPAPGVTGTEPPPHPRGLDCDRGTGQQGTPPDEGAAERGREGVGFNPLPPPPPHWPPCSLPPPSFAHGARTTSLARPAARPRARTMALRPATPNSPSTGGELLRWWYGEVKTVFPIPH